LRFARFFTIGLFFLLRLTPHAVAADSPSDSFDMTCAKASVWDQDGNSVVEMHGPVKVEFDHRVYTADNAVIWMTPVRIGAGQTPGQSVTMTLIGHAGIRQQWGQVLYPDVTVSFPVAGTIKLVGERTAESDAGSDLYKSAVAIRDAAKSGATTAPATTPANQAIAKTNPTTTATAPVSPQTDHSLPALPAVPGLAPPTARPATAPPGTQPVTSTPPPTHTIEFDLNDFTRERSSDGNLAFVFTNGVTLRYIDDKGNLLEFVAHDMVLFTNLKDMKSVGGGDDKNFIADHVTGAYFDQDVQIFVTPADGSAKGELRMRAERVYYDFATDRAVMTDVLFHTVDVKKQIAVFMRADKVRQLSQGEFKTENVAISSSAFNPPTYGMTAAHAYVREEDSGDPRIGARVEYNADNVLLNAFGVPFLYFPGMSGTMTARGSAFRDIGFENDNEFGFGLRSKWGLFESLNMVPPEGLEATYSADYFSKRGPGGGIDAVYNGGFVSDTDKQPWNFLGDLHAFFVDDRGVDVLGASRANSTPPDDFRGRLYFEHQHFFPDDFQLQLRLGYLSDSTFMPQWFNDEYQNGLPVDESIYLKHQVDSEVVAIAAEWQPNRAISTADEEQQNREVSELPQLDYDRVGESVVDDHLTLFSDSSAGAYKFDRNTESLFQQGFYAGVEPGLPSYAYTGDPGRTVERADTRQELDLPIDLGPVKVVPYVMGRYTGYSSGVVPPLHTPLVQSIPDAVALSSPPNRVIGAIGARLTTSFWHVDDSVESDIFDLHRLRHIIEPEINVFASASTLDQNRVLIYDPQVDAVNDIQAVQLALRQRWQTKRGGPGRWRSVDVFTLDTSVNLFANQPAPVFRNPADFRGAFFYSEPEFSLARNSANADATWRISDSTAVLADVQENLDYRKLATASIGVAVQRDQRLNYFIGTRYVADLDSNLATIEVNYELDKKYSVSATQSFDFASSKDVYYTFALIRKFDNFSASVRVYYDQTTAQKGFSFSLAPNGLSRGLGTSDLQQQQ
jgi:hypothetical protein